ncbi:MAG: lytic transglycosylase domain-containing protein, partial [Blastomonas sp.]|nr:lytic transglycosylase domain-containing protein [Blastomonas sp.]
GPGRYEQWRDDGRPLPAETRAYVAKIAPMLQSGGAATVVASASLVQPVRLSWTQGQLFAVRGNATADASGSFAAAAPPTSIPASPAPLNGLFVPVSGSHQR